MSYHYFHIIIRNKLQIKLWENKQYRTNKTGVLHHILTYMYMYASRDQQKNAANWTIAERHASKHMQVGRWHSFFLYSAINNYNTYLQKSQLKRLIFLRKCHLIFHDSGEYMLLNNIKCMSVLCQWMLKMRS